MRPRTLVVHTGGVGDFILALPALERLGRQGPLELAGRPERLQLAVDAGIAEAAHDLDSIAFDSLFAEPAPALTEFTRRFDRAVVWMRDDDGFIKERMGAMGIEDVRVFPGLPPEDWESRAGAYYAGCLDVPSTPGWRLRVERTHGAKNAVVIHPGSGGGRKNWPMVEFAAVAQILEAQGEEVRWSRGPADEAIVVPNTWSVLPARPLTELAKDLAGAALYLGNDSGITHLAAAVGCPTVAIFGPTNPRVWAPRGDHVRVVQGDPWPRIDEVVAAAAELRATR